MAGQQGGAFVTARKGFCYLTIKLGRRNFDMMRIRKYTLDADEKRHMRRLYPEIAFDWKKITQQLAEKRAGATVPGGGARTPPALRAPASRSTASTSQAPAPSMSTASRPVPWTWERCSMPSLKSIAA